MVAAIYHRQGYSSLEALLAGRLSRSFLSAFQYEVRYMLNGYFMASKFNMYSGYDFLLGVRV